MNDRDYGKNNGQFNNDPYNGMNNEFYNNFTEGYQQANYYGGDSDYTVPLENNGAMNEFVADSWNNYNGANYNQSGYDNAYNNYNNYGSYDYYNDYMNEEYNYYDDNGDYYMYEDQYSIDYSNGANNYSENNYQYSYSEKNYKEDIDSSIYEISNKLNNNVNEEILYSAYIDKPKVVSDSDSYNKQNNEYSKLNNIYNKSNDVYGKVNNIYNESNDAYGKESIYNRPNGSYNKGRAADDNKTVPLDIELKKPIKDNFNSSFNYKKSDDNYKGYNSNSGYFHRNGAYDNKLIPTEDIVFDDAYVVRNQLFEDEEKLFSLNDILSFFICIVFAVILAFLITRYVAQLTEVDGKSMTHNFQHNDDLLLDKFSYKVRKPKRFEVVVFPVPGEGHYIKRIIGLPGETVDVYQAEYNNGQLVKKSKICINGKELTDDVYGYEDITNTVGNNAHVKLGKDEYYVMGDNRNGSNDSRNRDVGAIKGSDFVGRAIFRIFPLSSFGPINHKINEKIYNGDQALKKKYNVTN